MLCCCFFFFFWSMSSKNYDDNYVISSHNRLCNWWWSLWILCIRRTKIFSPSLTNLFIFSFQNNVRSFEILPIPCDLRIDWYKNYVHFSIDYLLLKMYMDFSLMFRTVKPCKYRGFFFFKKSYDFMQFQQQHYMAHFGIIFFIFFLIFFSKITENNFDLKFVLFNQFLDMKTDPNQTINAHSFLSMRWIIQFLIDQKFLRIPHRCRRHEQSIMTLLHTHIKMMFRS